MNHPDPDDGYFIGWAETPKADRRFFLRAGLAMTATSAVLGAGLATMQHAPGPGQWDPDAVREWRGIVTAQPYAMLRSLDFGGGPRTALLSCLGKCGVAARLGALSGHAVVIRGSLVHRGRHTMIAVDEAGDWIRRDDGARPEPALAFPALEPLGEVALSGEILDSKCWFGAMRPAEGKVHKSCAALCIRGGIPPAFFARDAAHRSVLLIMTSNGQAHGADLLPLVAEPVRAVGRVARWGDLLLLDAPAGAIRRV